MSVARKYEFNTSGRPYANTDRKNKIVTVQISIFVPKPHGNNDCPRVISEPSVMALPSTMTFRLYTTAGDNRREVQPTVI